MSPTLSPGDRVLVDKLSGRRRRAGTSSSSTSRRPSGARTSARPTTTVSSGPSSGGSASALGVDLGEKDAVLRVIGVAGDHVTCCDVGGMVAVDGRPVAEPYLAPGSAAAETPFDVTVPAGRALADGRRPGPR